MSNYTRIYDKFTGYSTADCACEWCLHWRGKKRGCRLEECCCMEERLEAARREQAAHSGYTAQVMAES